MSRVLSVGLLQQGAPELRAVGRVDKQQLSVLGGQAVVHHHVHPIPKLPELRTHAEGTQ